MKIVIPMAGTGDRFVRAGYTDPKPLIKVGGKRIIQYIYEMFDPSDEFVFICNDNHLDTTDMRAILTEMAPGCTILSIPNHKKGPIFTVMCTDYNQYIKDDEEVIICYCDNPYVWDYLKFKEFVIGMNSDGCILSHVGFHPHRLSSTFMAHIKEGLTCLSVEEIKEKEPYTSDPMSEHASTGTYYFKKGSLVKKYFKEAIDKNINYNGEHYVTLMYNLLIKDGLNVHCYPTKYVTVFGTPEEVESFEAWQTLLNGQQKLETEEDVLRCYRYWKEYNEKRNT
jgi:NDP-sugar pyrophosphorylase family protein